MKTLKIMVLAVLAAIPIITGCSNRDENGNSKQLDAEIDQLRTALEKDLGSDVPSLSVLIESPGGRWFTSSVGKNGKAISADTYFRFASNTKNFTSAAILNMMEDGWLNLDDKIVQSIPTSNIPYVPDIPEWNFPNKSQVSIKQLLQHNAGVYDVSNDSVPGYGGDTYVGYMLEHFPNHQFTATDLVTQLTAKNLSYGLPNQQYHYSNTGYTILGEIISRVYSLRSGQAKTYGDYLRDKIYGPESKVPLALHFAEDAMDQQLPTPYVTGMIVMPGSVIISDRLNASPHVAEGNGIGTMNLLNRYIRTMMRAENVLSKETVTLMQTARGPANSTDNQYALGCSHHPTLGYGHNGATEGYLSTMMYDPKTEVSVVVVIPFWDLTEGSASLNKCLKALVDAAVAGRKAVGYP